MNTHHRRTLGFALALAVLASGPVAHAAPGTTDHPHAYALVIGSNPGGKGQQTLRYAQKDATRMAAVLRDLGAFPPQNVQLLQQPTADAVVAALDQIGSTLRANADRGIESRFFFYYSGHARARALELGHHRLPLDQLRDQIMALPAALTIVVLDACQSGEFSQIKGVQPAADFSFNSVSGLGATGVAVMASSSATELSQESERLGSSYFTHHLIAALRGAGDGNRDGRVSLDEAYEYAYQRTLESTAATVVGSQHVTLETTLAGKGDIALSYPAKSDAHLQLPTPMDADVLIQALPGAAAVVDVHKSAGSAMQLALPRGRYRATVRQRGAIKREVRRCEFALTANRSTVLDIAHCAVVPIEVTASKGDLGNPRPAPYWRRIGFEIGVGGGGDIRDAYTDRLEDFGFNEQFELFDTHLRLALTYRLRRNIDVVLDMGEMDRGRYHRSNTEGTHQFTWTTHTAGLAFRYILRPNRILRPFAQAGAGVARASTVYNMTAEPSDDRDVFWGVHLGVATGLQIMPWQRLGMLIRASYNYAPVIDNLIGDTHDSGGFDITLGLRTKF